MDTTLWIVIALSAIVVATIVWWLATRKRRTAQLRERFGPEYERVVKSEGDVRKAESELEAREKRVAKLEIQPISVEDAERFSRAWRDIQALFVDSPDRAIRQADRLVGEVMAVRGYPVGDFEQRVADISVDHADVVMNYRAARDIAVQHSMGRAATEDLRQAMVHYRALFRDLLETAPPTREEDVHETARRRL